MQKEFNWGNTGEIFRKTITKELFDEKIYTKFFDVESGDIVFDVGASIGPFSYSIIEKNPSLIFCFEPSIDEFEFLVKNTSHGNCAYINKGISNLHGPMDSQFVFMKEKNIEFFSTTFMKVIKDFNLQKIDFLKTDCEGGEYDIFNIENLFWIKNNVKKISGEWHLSNSDFKNKFRIFRDLYLRVFPKFEIYSVDGINITKNCWSDDFINYYKQVLIYIDNRDL